MQCIVFHFPHPINKRPNDESYLLITLTAAHQSTVQKQNLSSDPHYEKLQMTSKQNRQQSHVATLLTSEPLFIPFLSEIMFNHPIITSSWSTSYGIINTRNYHKVERKWGHVRRHRCTYVQINWRLDEKRETTSIFIIMASSEREVLQLNQQNK